MAEDGIPEILAERRLGHDVPGMRGHVSDRMRGELKVALQARWEDSLRVWANIHPGHVASSRVSPLNCPPRSGPRSGHRVLRPDSPTGLCGALYRCMLAPHLAPNLAVPARRRWLASFGRSRAVRYPCGRPFVSGRPHRRARVGLRPGCW